MSVSLRVIPIVDDCEFIVLCAFPRLVVFLEKPAADVSHRWHAVAAHEQATGPFPFGVHSMVFRIHEDPFPLLVCKLQLVCYLKYLSI